MIRLSVMHFVFFLICFFAFTGNASGNRVLFDKPHSKYIITEVVDLDGKTIQIPESCVLMFKRGGKVKNGVLVGRETRVKARRSVGCIFENISLQGTWSVRNIYSQWFDFVDGDNNTRQIRNMFTLCGEEETNRVFISSGEYWMDSYDDVNNSPIIISIPSNTHIFNEAVFRALPGSHAQSFLFSFWGSSNCSWIGGRIIGDLHTHLEDNGEQGFGLALRGAKNIVIRSVICDECWGDGINLQFGAILGHNENIVIDRVSCNANRRQGISVEDGINVVISHSSFTKTGSFRGISPMRGIDIEPCYDEAIIRRITIKNCYFVDNVGGGVECCEIKPTDSSISIRDIHDVNGGLRLNNCLIDSSSKGIAVSRYDCPNGKLRFKKTVQNVTIVGSSFLSTLNESDNKDVISNILLQNVRFRTSEQRTWNFYCVSWVCATLHNVLFDRCEFVVEASSTLSAILPSGGDWTGVMMQNCRLIENRDMPIFIPCDMQNSYIETSGVLSFINCKNTNPLVFSGNKVQVHNFRQESPFFFHASGNPEYAILDNIIITNRAVDQTKLISFDLSNRKDLKVSVAGNRFFVQ